MTSHSHFSVTLKPQKAEQQFVRSSFLRNLKVTWISCNIFVCVSYALLFCGKQGKEKDITACFVFKNGLLNESCSLELS